MPDNESDAYQLGWKSWFNGSDNPYEEDSKNWDDWNRGNEEASIEDH